MVASHTTQSSGAIYSLITPANTPQQFYICYNFVVDTKKCTFINHGKFLESDFTLRTKDNHEMQFQRLNGELKDYFSKSYGVNRRSSLNDSRYFHVIGGLPPDAMHDILEGVLQYCVKEILKVYIMEKKFFTLQELNKRIVSFDYGYHNESNKPAKILRQKLFSDDHNLKQHGKYALLYIGNMD